MGQNYLFFVLRKNQKFRSSIPLNKPNKLERQSTVQQVDLNRTFVYGRDSLWCWITCPTRRRALLVLTVTLREQFELFHRCYLQKTTPNFPKIPNVRLCHPPFITRSARLSKLNERPMWSHVGDHPPPNSFPNFLPFAPSLFSQNFPHLFIHYYYYYYYIFSSSFSFPFLSRPPI